MKKPLLKLILFAGIPVMVIIVLFKINVYLDCRYNFIYCCPGAFNMTYILSRVRSNTEKEILKRQPHGMKKRRKAKAPINATVVHGFILLKPASLRKRKGLSFSC